MVINSQGSINVEIEAGKKPARLSMLEARQGGQNVNINEIQGENNWEKKVRQLTTQGQVLITTAVTAATTGAGSTIGAGAVSSAIATGISGFASNLAVNTINSGSNVGKGLKSATTKESLRSLGKNMLAAGVTTGIMNGTGFGNVNSALMYAIWQLPSKQVTLA